MRMGKERKYLASCDDGHDHFQFEFYSEHKANSKANIEDAMNYHNKHYGHHRGMEVIETYLQGD